MSFGVTLLLETLTDNAGYVSLSIDLLGEQDGWGERRCGGCDRGEHSVLYQLLRAVPFSTLHPDRLVSRRSMALRVLLAFIQSRTGTAGVTIECLQRIVLIIYCTHS